MEFIGEGVQVKTEPMEQEDPISDWKSWTTGTGYITISESSVRGIPANPDKETNAVLSTADVKRELPISNQPPNQEYENLLSTIESNLNQESVDKVRIEDPLLASEHEYLSQNIVGNINDGLMPRPIQTTTTTYNRKSMGHKLRGRALPPMGHKLRGRVLPQAAVRPYKCDCGKDFILKHHLTAHQLIHTGERPFKCDFCGKGFQFISKLQRHTLTHTEKKTTKCETCGMWFSNDFITTHKLTHTEEQSVACTSASVSHDFCSNSMIAVEKKLKLEPPDTIDDNYEDTVDSDNDNLEKREQTPHGLNKIEIQIGRSEESESSCKCEICGKDLPNFEDLTLHQNIHIGSGEYKITHIDDKPYKCGACGKGFSQRSGLAYHKLTHTGEKPHACNICGRRFTGISDLNRHKLTHTRETAQV